MHVNISLLGCKPSIFADDLVFGLQESSSRKRIAKRRRVLDALPADAVQGALLLLLPVVFPQLDIVMVHTRIKLLTKPTFGSSLRACCC